jgi:hypothetical protein
MGSADREMLSDKVDEEHEETGDDEAGVDVPLRRALLALPRLHLAAAHRNFLLPLPPPRSLLFVAV